jgi:deazaflavin-dependent oxidoreductase (nitroreductase family)
MSSLHTFVYRVTNGQVGRRLANNDMLLLTTTGRSTGRSHTVPLLYLREAERHIVVASYGGRPAHPEWYRNLAMHPVASIQILDTHQDVEATTMTDLEHDQWWPNVVATYNDYATYQSRTNRQIPLVWLDPVLT